MKIASFDFAREPGWSYAVDKEGNLVRIRRAPLRREEIAALRQANPHRAGDPEFEAFLAQLEREAGDGD